MSSKTPLRGNKLKVLASIKKTLRN